MSVPQVSRYIRLGLEARYANDYNALLAAACAEFGVEPYEINFAAAPDAAQNFFRGDRTIESLLLNDEPELPALAMWTGEGQNTHRQMPRLFSGWVTGYWRFFLFVQGMKTAGLVDLREATEAAMLGVLDAEGLGYRGDLSWQALDEQQYFDQDDKHRGWVQQVTYAATFEVNI